MKLVKAWFDRHFADPQVTVLAVVLLIGAGVIVFFGGLLAPVLASIVIAYLLEGLVVWGERLRMPRTLSVVLVFTFFMAAVLLTLLWLLPLLSRQLAGLLQQIPTIVTATQHELIRLPQRFEFISETQVNNMLDMVGRETTKLVQATLGLSLVGVRNIISIFIYLIVVPFLVFFFMKDKKQILAWATQFLPRDHSLTSHIWHDVDRQIGNYIRGKVWEIMVVWVGSYVTFTWLGLSYSMLLSLFVGLSVLIPYIGATVMTLPVAAIAFFDFGAGRELVVAIIAYGIIQLLDGNLLSPLLFSEVVNLHPVAIIVAVLVFGGVWGFWGVFFAIPLATLVQAIIKAWPREFPDQVHASPPPDANKRVSDAA